VPKESGWLNVGIGGFAERIKSAGQDIKAHWAQFAAKLGGGLTRGAHYDPTGYSYFLRGRVDVVRRDNAFITGDAAGLASRDLGEGIGPAIRSGLRAAEAIVSRAPYRLEDVTGMSVASIARSMLSRAARPFGPHGRRRARNGGAVHGLRHGNQ
jgi:flavin-dependent dehydrogenase